MHIGDARKETLQECAKNSWIRMEQRQADDICTVNRSSGMRGKRHGQPERQKGYVPWRAETAVPWYTSESLCEDSVTAGSRTEYVWLKKKSSKCCVIGSKNTYMPQTCKETMVGQSVKGTLIIQKDGDEMSPE